MKSIFAASMLVSFALALSRLSGFVREVLIAARLGSSETADGAILILTLPDFLVGLLLTGGVNAALVPMLKNLGGMARRKFLLRVFAWVFFVFTGLALVFVATAPHVFALLAPELDIDAMADFRLAFAFSMMALPIAGLIGISASYLTTIGKFAVPGLSVLAFNCVLSIYIGASLPNGTALAGLGIVILFASLLRLALHLYPMRAVLLGSMKDVFSSPSGLPPKDGFALRFVQGIGAFSIIVGVPFMFRSLHASNGDGALTLFNYAQKLFELPAAMLIAPVAVVLLPKLSAMVSQGDDAFYSYVDKGIMAVLALSGIALGVGFLFMDVIVTLVFGYGSISAQNLADIAAIARLMLLAMPFYAISQITGITLNAMKRTNAFFILSILSCVMSVVVYTLLEGFVSGVQRAPLAFVSFFIVLGLSSVMAIFPVRRWTVNGVKKIAVLVVRLSIALVPFIMLLQVYNIASIWEAAAWMILATLFCGGLMLSHLKALMQMRIDTF